MTVLGLDTLQPQLILKPLRGFLPEAGRILRDRLLNFEYESVLKIVDVARFELDNTDGKLLSLESMALGVGLEVAWGYVGALTQPRTVTVKKVKGMAGERRTGGGRRAVRESIGATGKIFLECWAKTHLLNRLLADDGTQERGPRVFMNMKISEIVTEMARNYGFAGDRAAIEPPSNDPVKPYVVIPTDETDAMFLMRQARHLGYVFAIEEALFRFHSREFGKTPIKLCYAGGDPDVMNLEVEGDLTLGAPRRVSARGIDPMRYGVANFTTDPIDEGPMNQQPGASSSEAREAGVVQRPASDLGMGQYVFDNVRSELDVMAISRPSERAMNAALRRLKAQADKKWKLKLELVGNPKVFARQWIDLDGAGALADGEWYCRKVTHKYTAGNVFTTTVDEATRKKPGDRGRTRVVNAPVEATPGEATGEGTAQTVLDQEFRPPQAVAPGES